MQNVEFKSELRDVELARHQCGLIGARFLGDLEQTDTYFRMPDGRLKRRETWGYPTTWIFYHRPDRASARLSNYTIFTDEQARSRWGVQSLREWLTVVKRRELWLIDNTRIHLDRVERLGRFIEFEAQVGAKYDVEECSTIVAHLRGQFGPVMGEPIAVSYCDLMAAELADRVE